MGLHRYGLILGLLMLTSCVKHVPGKIIEIGYRPESTWLMTMYVGDTPILIPQTDPEHWYVIVQTDEGKTYDCAITPQQWKNLLIGEDYYCP